MNLLNACLKLFNFIFSLHRFTIVWIPLLLLVIFNTILVIDVQRLKQNKEYNNEGIQLRRHAHGNLSEQRKTTIMLSKKFVKKNESFYLRNKF